jgi:hypothetical protein
MSCSGNTRKPQQLTSSPAPTEACRAVPYPYGEGQARRARAEPSRSTCRYRILCGLCGKVLYMANVRMEWNEGELAKLQHAMNAKAQDIIRQVNNAMAKRPVNEVIQALRIQLAENGFEPDEDGIRNYAQAISEGTLTE